MIRVPVERTWEPPGGGGQQSTWRVGDGRPPAVCAQGQAVWDGVGPDQHRLPGLPFPSVPRPPPPPGPRQVPSALTPAPPAGDTGSDVPLTGRSSPPAAEKPPLPARPPRQRALSPAPPAEATPAEAPTAEAPPIAPPDREPGAGPPPRAAEAGVPAALVPRAAARAGAGGDAAVTRWPRGARVRSRVLRSRVGAGDQVCEGARTWEFAGATRRGPGGLGSGPGPGAPPAAGGAGRRPSRRLLWGL